MSQPTNDQIIAGLEYIRAEKNYKSGWLYVNAKQLIDNPNIPDDILAEENEWVTDWVKSKQKEYRESAEIRVPKELHKKFAQELGDSNLQAVAAAVAKMMHDHIDKCAESRVATYQEQMAATDIEFEDIPY